MVETSLQNKELMPKGITCPEGMWLIQAALFYGKKEKGCDTNDKKIWQIIEEFVHFLVITPELKIFTINSFDGRESVIKREYMRGSQFKADLMRELQSCLAKSENIYSSDVFHFVSRGQFENYLADKPFEVEKTPVTLETLPQNHEEGSQKQKSADLNIIGALLGLLLGKSSSDIPYSQFSTQQSIIDAIHANYGKEHGLSQRNLESKFSQAKEKLKERL